MAYINNKKVLSVVKTEFVPAVYQEKTITPSNFTPEVVADYGYAALSKVKLDGILVDPHNPYTSQTDSTIAYQKSVPSGALKYATLDKLGFMSYKSENEIVLSDVAETTTNGITYSVSNGVPYLKTGTSSQATYLNLGSFTLNAGTYYLKAFGNNAGTYQTYFAVLQDNSSQNIAFSYDSTSSGTFTLNATTTLNYVIVIRNAVSVSNIQFKDMVVSGSTAPSEFKVGFEGIRDSIVTSIKSYGANLADTSLFELGAINVNTGEDLANNERMRSNYIEVKPNTQYTLKWDNTNVNVICYDSDKVKTGNSAVAGTFTTTATTKYVRFYSGLITESTQIMLNYGSTALTYKPYRGLIDTFTIPDEVKALDGYGRGINENCYNELDLDTKEFTDKDTTINLGTLTFASSDFSTTNHVGWVRIPNAKSGGYLENALCSDYDLDTTHSQSNMPNMSYYISNAYINIKNTSCNSASELKTALSGVNLQYELATYSPTDVSAYLSNKYIEVEAGGYLVFENQYQQKVPSEVTYLVEVE